MRGWSRASLDRTLILLLLAMAVGCAPKRLPPLDTGPGMVPELGGVAVPQLLDVGLAEGQESLLLEVDGPALLLEGDSRRRLHVFPDGGGRLQVVRDGEQVRWNAGAGWAAHASIVLQPLDPDQRLTHADQDYRGDFLVIPSPMTTGLTLVNQVGLEPYLYGVVPWEIGRHGLAERAALQAQAVAARTYTISHMGSRRSVGFDVYASVMDQVYKGSRHEDALCNEAVDGTAGLVLKHGQDLVDAYYSACCGGFSSRIEAVWPREPVPYLVHHPDRMGQGPAFCSESRHFSWEEEWAAGRLEEILQTTLPAYVQYMSEDGRSDWARPIFVPRHEGGDWRQPGRLRGLEIVSRTPSGRVGTLIVTTDAGSYNIKGDRTRWVMPPASGRPTILRSARFELDLVRRDGRLVQVRARGQGFGHGIGMCQTGALGMARQGFSVREILAHYYPGSNLAHLGSGS